MQVSDAVGGAMEAARVTLDREVAPVTGAVVSGLADRCSTLEIITAQFGANRARVCVQTDAGDFSGPQDICELLTDTL